MVFKEQLKNMRINFLKKISLKSSVLLVCILALYTSGYGQCPTFTNTTQSFCNSQNPTLASLTYTNNGGGIKWFASASALPSAFLPLSTPIISNSTFYADDATGACGARQLVTVLFYGPPTAGSPGQTFCYFGTSTRTVFDLTPNGPNINWYLAPSGGTPLQTNALLLDNTAYFASQINPATGCESTRKLVAVNLQEQPATPIGAFNQQFCNDPLNPPTLANLQTSGNVWFAQPTDGFAIPSSTVLVNGQTYYSDMFVTPCYSNSRLPIAVSLTQPNNAGISATKRICENQIATTTPFNLFAELTGTPQLTGTWLGPVSTSNGHLGTLNVASLTAAGSPYVFTYPVGIGACPLNIATVTIIVESTPTASLSISPTAVCAESLTTVTIQGTPNAIVTYIENGIIKTVAIPSSGILVLSSSFLVSTTFQITSVASSGILSCTNASIFPIKLLTIISLPTASVSQLNTAPFCSGENGTIIFTGIPGDTIFYTIGSGLLLNLIIEPDGNNQLVLPFASTTIISLVSVTSGSSPFCNKQVNNQITINVIDLPSATIQLSSNLICENDSATVTFIGTPNAIVTYLINGVSQTITLDNAGTNFLLNSFTVSTVFTLVSVVTTGITPCFKSLNGIFTISINPLPTASISGTTSACEGDSRLIIFSGTPSATLIYTTNGVINTLVLNNLGVYTLIVPYLVTTEYALISVTSSGTTSCTRLLINQSAMIVVTKAVNAGQNATKIVCTNDGIQNLFLLLGPNAHVGGTWINPNGQVGDGLYNPLTSAIGNYTYLVLGTPPCQNDEATVNIRLAITPNAGIGTSIQKCTNSDTFDLFSLLTGNPQTGGTWSPVLHSNSSNFNPAIDLAGSYTYTVTGDLACGNATATIIVNLTPGPNAGISGSAQFCSNSLPASLFLSLGGNPTLGGTWTPTLLNGIYDPLLNAPGTYTYSFSGSGVCDNDSATVIVVENPVPSAGTNGTASFCLNDGTADLLNYLNGSAQQGGVWTPTLSSGTGVFNPSVDSSGQYTYTVGGGLCSISTSVVMVTVTQSPNAGGLNASLLVLSCINATSINLFSGLNGTQQTDGIWRDAANTIVSNIVNPSLLTAGNYSYTYTVSGGVSPCNTDSETVVLIIDLLPNAGVFNPISPICNTGGTLDLFSLLSSYQLGGIWKNSSGELVSNPLNLVSIGEGVLNYSYSITNICGTDVAQVQFSLFNNPQLNTANISVVSPNCQDQNLTFNFTNMNDGVYTINFDISGSNNFPNQTVNLNIISGNGNFTLSNTFFQNLGVTNFSFLNISNTASNCTIALASIVKSVTINSFSNLDDINLTVLPKCLGENSVVSISGAINLQDGNYQFSYTIPNGVGFPNLGTSTTVAIAGGIGSFVIPGSSFPNPGNFLFSIIKILNLSTGCNNLNENASGSITIKDTPKVVNALINIGTSCINKDNIVTITNAANLSGNYLLNYSISNSNVGIGQVTVAFVSGEGSFSIPGTTLPLSGLTTLTITKLVDAETLCGLFGSSFSITTFNVYGLATPIITPKGNQFCEVDLPTIASLSINVTGVDPIVWYDATILGNAYTNTTLLQNGVTYYATFVNAAGCQSTPRLPVIVDFTRCPNLIIPDGFSPNNDAINDTFEIQNIRTLFPNFTLEIYNRYGNLIFSGSNQVLDWNGTTTQNGINIGNEKLPVGVYFYILNYNDADIAPKQGRIYLSR